MSALTAQWMSKAHSDIQDSSLAQLNLPGTHDSAAYRLHAYSLQADLFRGPLRWLRALTSLTTIIRCAACWPTLRDFLWHQPMAYSYGSPFATVEDCGDSAAEHGDARKASGVEEDKGRTNFPADSEGSPDCFQDL